MCVQTSALQILLVVVVLSAYQRAMKMNMCRGTGDKSGADCRQGV